MNEYVRACVSEFKVIDNEVRFPHDLVARGVQQLLIAVAFGDGMVPDPNHRHTLASHVGAHQHRLLLGEDGSGDLGGWLCDSFGYWSIG